jgi:hypothetical protein
MQAYSPPFSEANNSSSRLVASKLVTGLTTDGNRDAANTFAALTTVRRPPAEYDPKRQLQVPRRQAGVLGDPREHSRTYLFAVVKGEYKIGPAWSRKRFVRPRLALYGPAAAEQG